MARWHVDTAEFATNNAFQTLAQPNVALVDNKLPRSKMWHPEAPMSLSKKHNSTWNVMNIWELYLSRGHLSYLITKIDTEKRKKNTNIYIYMYI